MRRIFVLRGLYLGDMLCAIPALRSLRNAAPNAEILLCSLPWAREFAGRFAAYVDRFLEMPGFPGLVERESDRHDVDRFLAVLRGGEIDLAIQLHGSGTLSNALIEQIGASRIAGYFAAGQRCPDPSTFLPYPSDGNEIHRNLRLVEHLGAPPQGDYLEFPVLDSDSEKAVSLLGEELFRNRDYLCLHIGAKLPTRRWSAKRYAEVGNALARQGYEIVLTGGSAESELVAKVESLLDSCHNVCGRTDLGTLGAVVSRAKLLISGDTGVAHVAAAVGTPSVLIVLSSDFKRWAPLDRERHRVVMNPVVCRPCEHVECPIGFVCAEQMSTAEVLNAARQQLLRWSSATREFFHRSFQHPEPILATSAG